MALIDHYEGRDCAATAETDGSGKKKLFSQEGKVSLELILELLAKRRSPCVQFVAVMKCRATGNWPNLSLPKQFGTMEGELVENELGGVGGSGRGESTRYGFPLRRRCAGGGVEQSADDFRLSPGT